ncbi:ArpU family phage packaging/lysis transcriptional regulator [Pediococcus acidilactici]|uniref:ArpU family phage packaging/lysis transcriptional regulator n=1 Tax=Pediococcus acidilactici TaxID=1254 RepID=UPI00232EB523|nr:ArpU family phage packaging/lysis transcriptional regulator [Pediococcus acidilactici]MDB8867665.1 hypothetical protein [Pediococcus acidilactici]
MDLVARKADKKLKKCRSLMRIARKNLTDLKSPTMDSMPASTPYGNQVEARVIKQASAQQELQEIYQAITWLKKDEQELLFTKYFDFEEPSNTAVAYALNIDESQYYRLRNKALKEFAESYMAGSLFENV